ncbi:MAG: 50S ribosomal protein L13 [Candidatus Diapherotrites archaeon]|nr:50S ribosomal protein L13 [Candidatus Diapherotrites archaeon]
MTIIDAQDHVFGRLASHVAKRLTNGEKIDIINADHIVLVGTQESALNKFRPRHEMRALGNPSTGPKHPRTVEGLARRAIWGMLPQRTTRFKAALANLTIHAQVPAHLKEKPAEKIQAAMAGFDRPHVYLKEISRLLGAKR